MTGSIVTLGGEFLDGSAAISWAQEPGIEPSKTIIICDRAVGEGLYNRGLVPLDLVIGPRIIKNVYITSTTAGNDPETIGLVCQDFRFRWAYKAGRARYNVKEKTQFLTLVGVDKPPEQNRQIVPNLRYKVTTLKNRKDVWEIGEAMTDFFQSVDEKIELGDLKRAIELEDFDEEGSMPGIVQSFLDQLGGYDIKPLDSGAARVYDIHDRSEEQELKKDEDARYINSGWVEVAKRSHERPQAIDFYFTVEPELRFDFLNRASGTPFSTVSDGREPRELENITGSPVREMKIGTIQGDRIVAEGTPITFPQLYAALPDALQLPLNATQLGYLNETIVLRYYMGRGQYGLLFFYQKEGTPDKEWQKVIRAVVKDWHRYFRIIKPWRDRILAIRPFRAGFDDITTKTRQPAQFWCDYTEVPSKRNWHKTRKSRDDMDHDYVNFGYAAGSLDNGEIAPGNFTIRDPESGTFRLDLKRSSWGDHDNLIPARINTASGILEDPSKGFWTIIGQQGLEPGWQCATVFSVIPEPEFGLKSYKKITVRPDDAEGVLKVPGGVGLCKGPRMSVIIPYSDVTSARYYWTETQKAAIEEFFFTGAPLPDVLLLNEPHLKQIAFGEGARIYSALLDRPEGSYSTSILSNTQLTGNIASVSRMVQPNGDMSTDVILTRLDEQVNAFAYMTQLERQELRGSIVRP